MAVNSVFGPQFAFLSISGIRKLGGRTEKCEDQRGRTQTNNSETDEGQKERQKEGSLSWNWFSLFGPLFFFKLGIPQMCQSEDRRGGDVTCAWVLFLFGVFSGSLSGVPCWQRERERERDFGEEEDERRHRKRRGKEERNIETMKESESVFELLSDLFSHNPMSKAGKEATNKKTDSLLPP